MGEVADITGQRFNRLTALSFSHIKKGEKHWNFSCECGGEKIIAVRSVKRGLTKSCGCLPKENAKLQGRKKRKDITGFRKGRLTAVSFSHMNKFNHSCWLFKCDCGEEKILEINNVLNGNTNSCGCFNKEVASVNAKKMAGDNTLEYGLASKRRRYGTYKRGAKDRGYKFDISFDLFVETASQNCAYCGTPPSNIQKSTCDNGDWTSNGIDRKDNNRGYTKENIVPCCSICNKMKLDMELSLFTTQIKKIYENNLSSLRENF